VRHRRALEFSEACVRAAFDDFSGCHTPANFYSCWVECGGCPLLLFCCVQSERTACRKLRSVAGWERRWLCCMLTTMCHAEVGVGGRWRTAAPAGAATSPGGGASATPLPPWHPCRKPRPEAAQQPGHAAMKSPLLSRGAGVTLRPLRGGPLHRPTHPFPSLRGPSSPAERARLCAQAASLGGPPRPPA